jgi:hypothetical protein
MNAENHPELERDYWEKVQREAPLIAINKSEEAAKQLITLTSLLSTIYFGIASFNEALKQTVSGPFALLLVLPLPLWLGSLLFATRVIVPRAYVVKQIQADYVAISKMKHRHLQWSYALLVTSMFVLLVEVAVYLLWVPAPPP